MGADERGCLGKRIALGLFSYKQGLCEEQNAITPGCCCTRCTQDFRILGDQIIPRSRQPIHSTNKSNNKEGVDRNLQQSAANTTEI